MSVTAWYVTNNEFHILFASVRWMQQYDWISQIVILHGDKEKPGYFGFLTDNFNKVYEQWTPFGGRGPDPKAKYELSLVPSVEDGGWDELSHRNVALSIAYQYDNEYVLAIDSDEVFMGNSETLLTGKPDVVYFEFNTWIYNNAIKKYPISMANGLRRIHPRIWKKGIYYLPHSKPTPGYKNQTIHVWPDVKRFNNVGFDKPGSFNLQHLHQMFASKRSIAYNNYPEEKVLLIDYDWNYYFENIFEIEGTNKKFGEKIEVGI